MNRSKAANDTPGENASFLWRSFSEAGHGDPTEDKHPYPEPLYTMDLIVGLAMKADLAVMRQRSFRWDGIWAAHTVILRALVWLRWRYDIDPRAPHPVPH